MTAIERPAVVDAPVADLREHPRNPRTIRPERLEQLKRTLEAERGMLDARPLIALPDGTVVAGNQRLAAARDLGWETIPTVYVDLDEEQQTRWMLLDNRPFGADNDEAVAVLLAELEGRGSDLELTGYTRPETDALIRSLTRPAADPDDAPPAPAEPKSVRGEVYELGPHRLMCGDATDYANAQELLDGAEVETLWTDPPYGIAYEAMRRDDVIANDEDARRARVVLEDALDAVTADSYFVCCSWRSLGDTILAMENAEIVPKACIVWDKGHAVQNLDRFGKRHEMMVYAGPYGGEKTVDSDVWEIARDYKPDHPTPKPVELIARALSVTTQRSSAIYDPFGGSGSTLIAAEQLGRHAFLMELNPGYCDVIRQRYADYVDDQQFAP